MTFSIADRLCCVAHQRPQSIRPCCKQLAAPNAAMATELPRSGVEARARRHVRAQVLTPINDLGFLHEPEPKLNPLAGSKPAINLIPALTPAGLMRQRLTCSVLHRELLFRSNCVS